MSYLAAWVIWRPTDEETARNALEYVVPVGEESTYIDRALNHIKRFISPEKQKASNDKAFVSTAS